MEKISFKEKLKQINKKIEEHIECSICIGRFTSENYPVSCNNFHLHCVTCHKKRNSVISSGRGVDSNSRDTCFLCKIKIPKLNIHRGLPFVTELLGLLKEKEEIQAEIRLDERDKFRRLQSIIKKKNEIIKRQKFKLKKYSELNKIARIRRLIDAIKKRNQKKTAHPNLQDFFSPFKVPSNIENIVRKKNKTVRNQRQVSVSSTGVIERSTLEKKANAIFGLPRPSNIEPAVAPLAPSSSSSSSSTFSSSWASPFFSVFVHNELSGISPTSDRNATSAPTCTSTLTLPVASSTFSSSFLASSSSSTPSSELNLVSRVSERRRDEGEAEAAISVAAVAAAAVDAVDVVASTPPPPSSPPE